MVALCCIGLGLVYSTAEGKQDDALNSAAVPVSSVSLVTKTEVQLRWNELKYMENRRAVTTFHVWLSQKQIQTLNVSIHPEIINQNDNLLIYYARWTGIYSSEHIHPVFHKLHEWPVFYRNIKWWAWNPTGGRCPMLLRTEITNLGSPDP